MDAETKNMDSEKKKWISVNKAGTEALL